jgi:hypothetical protein
MEQKRTLVTGVYEERLKAIACMARPFSSIGGHVVVCIGPGQISTTGVCFWIWREDNQVELGRSSRGPETHRQ